MKKFFGVLLLVLAGSVVAIPLFRQQPFDLRAFSPLQRVMGETTGTRSASVFAARGEYESFQVAVLPYESNLRLLGIEASDLSSSRGPVISSSNVTLYREHFVLVKGPLMQEQGPNRSLGPGRYPDPLIPVSAPSGARLRAVPVDLTSTEPVLIWVDIFVPRDAAPGSYEGTIRVASNRVTLELPVSLTVWDFELPLRPTLKSSFAYWTPQTREAVEELLRHRLMPLRISSDSQRRDTRSIREMEHDWAQRLGLSTVDTSFWSGADQGRCTMGPAPSVEQIRKAVGLHSPELELYNYTADEIVNCTNLTASLVAWAQTLHAAGLKNLVVMPPTPELLDDATGSGRSVVDIWVILPKLFDRAAGSIQRAMHKGDQVWSYSALAQDSYSPKWLIDYEPINPRIQAGFLSQSLGLTGLLYWRIDRWSDDPWNDVNNAGVFSSDNFPGEGLLVYPGSDVGLPGVVPSIRLKQLRDGVEDFEYIEVLKRLGSEDKALAMSRRVAPNWRDWAKDPTVLEATRHRLGEEIQSIVRTAR